MWEIPSGSFDSDTGFSPSHTSLAWGDDAHSSRHGAYTPTSTPPALSPFSDHFHKVAAGTVISRGDMEGKKSSSRSLSNTIKLPLKSVAATEVDATDEQLQQSIEQALANIRDLYNENEKLHKGLLVSEGKREKALDALTEVMANASLVAGIHAQYHGGEVRGEGSSAPVLDEVTLLTHMRDQNDGIPIKDRWWRLALWPQCFIASELVGWLTATGWASHREQATQIGQYLCEQGDIYHVSRERGFEDDFLFFRFRETPVNVKQSDWKFSQTAVESSVALSSRLAMRIESAEDECERLHHLKTFRKNIVYLSLPDKDSHGREWTLQRSRNDVDVYMMRRPTNAPKDDPKYRIMKTVGRIPVAGSQFISEFLDFRTRKRWQGLFADGRLITRLGANTRIIHRTSTSILKPIWPRDVCCLQDHFVEKVSNVDISSGTGPQHPSRQSSRLEHGSTPPHSLIKDAHDKPANGDVKSGEAATIEASGAGDSETNETADPSQEMHVLYEVSVTHQQVGPVPGFVRADLLLVAYILRPIPGDPNSAELTMISQVDFKGTNTPEWFVDKWLGQQGTGTLGQAAPPFNSPFRPVVSTTRHTEDNEEGEGVQAQSIPAGSSVQSRNFSSLLLKTGGPSTTDLTDANSLAERTELYDMYDLLAVIGQGAFSKIFQVRCKRTKALFAMKVLNKKQVVKSRQERHVITERNIMAKMNNPFVVRMTSAFQTSKHLYMVMTWAAGGDLFTSLRRAGLAEQLACLYVAELVVALRYLHAQKVVHRDVKPENILIGEDGHVVLTDFGLSKDNMEKSDRTFSLSGTAEYVSPEMLLNTGHGVAVDWWQLGIVLHEMLSGKHPFYHANTYKMHQNIIYKPPTLAANVSSDACSLLQGMFIKDPTRRLGINNNDIEKHALFAKHGIEWSAVRDKRIQPVTKPDLKFDGDVSNFEKMFTGQNPRLSVDQSSLANSPSHSSLAYSPSTSANQAQQAAGGLRAYESREARWEAAQSLWEGWAWAPPGEEQERPFDMPRNTSFLVFRGDDGAVREESKNDHRCGNGSA